ncbi:hypothetical protein O0L34_g10745 [Tuta absoluta]|nr:hypothetical protein O0L34_g10745 [Tuta absoluta]
MKQRLVAHRRVHSAVRRVTLGPPLGAHWGAAVQMYRVQQELPNEATIGGAQEGTFRGKARHSRSTAGERPFKCTECSKSFQMKQRLVAHRRVHSAVKASYLCNLCGKHFSTHSNRQRHMIIHTGLRPFRCEMCEKSFKHASEKRAHITYVHLKKPWPKRSRGKRRTESRQGIPGHPPAPADMEPQSLWPCDPKMDQINNIMDDKPGYYNPVHLKI